MLAFPCNQFGEQEPEPILDIERKITDTYDIEFPLFNKINVVGEDASPAFNELIGKEFYWINFSIIWIYIGTIFNMFIKNLQRSICNSVINELVFCEDYTYKKLKQDS